MLTLQYVIARSSAQDAAGICSWPAKLCELHVSGGIHDKPLLSLSDLPPSLTRLSIGNCPNLSMVSIEHILRTKGSQLHHLEIVAPIPGLSRRPNSLVFYMMHVPNLHYLKISVDFLFEHRPFLENSWCDNDYRLALRQIDLDCFDPAFCDFFGPDDLYSIFTHDQAFDRIRKVRIHRRLGWHTMKEVQVHQDIDDLDELLKALAREDGANAEVDEPEAGVILFGKG